MEAEVEVEAEAEVTNTHNSNLGDSSQVPVYPNKREHLQLQPVMTHTPRTVVTKTT